MTPAPATAAARRRAAGAPGAGGHGDGRRRGGAPPRRVSGPSAPRKSDDGRTTGLQKATPSRANGLHERVAAAQDKRAGAPRGKAEPGARSAGAPRGKTDARGRSAAPRAGSSGMRGGAGLLTGRVAAAAAAAAALPLREHEIAPAPRRKPAAVPKPKQTRTDLPLGARLVAWVRALPDHRLLDRLIGGRIWIVLIGTLLVGLVTLQLSLLKLNAGIGTAVEESTTLIERNAALRAQISRLSDAERVVGTATQMGLVMPPQGSPRFLQSGAADARTALGAMRAPAQSAAAAAAATGAADPAAAGGAIAPTG